jgi:hypothetical protein
MAHFAEINSENKVIRVIRVSDELESIGSEWCNKNFGGRWIQTSYNGNIRGSFAGENMIYDEQRGLFVRDEQMDEFFTHHWQGLIEPTSPSVIIDAVPRSGNIFLSTLVNYSFPNLFQRWGYMKPHNPETFSYAPDKFDLVLVPLRNPEDSLRSEIVIGNLTDDDIDLVIEHCKNMLISIQNNLSKLKIIKFENLVSDPQTVVEEIGNLLNLNPRTYNENFVKERIYKINGMTPNFYSLPIENGEEMLVAQNRLQSERFLNNLNECKEIYQSIYSLV